jgi:hypothetical protein
MNSPHVVRSTIWRLVPLAVGVAVLNGLVQRSVPDLTHQSILGFGAWVTICIIAGYVARSQGATGSQAIWVAWWTNLVSGMGDVMLSWFGLGAANAPHAATNPQLVNLADLANPGAGLLAVLAVLVGVGLGVLITWIVAAPFAMLGYWVRGGQESVTAYPAV